MSNQPAQALDRAPHGVLYLAMLLVLTGTAEAARLNYELEASVQHSDNIALTETDPVDETIVSPRLRFDFAEAGSALEVKARGDVRYLHYLDNTFDDETRADFAGQLNWGLLPGRLHWVAEDYLSQQPVDLRAGFTPGNQQQVNVFITGPTLHARLGGATSAQLDLRYANSYAEVTPEFDSDRYSAAARLQRELSPVHRVSLNLEGSRVEFDEAAQIFDYDRRDAWVGYNRNHPRIDLDFALGHSRIEPKDGSTDHSGSLARARVDWRPTARSTLTFDVRRQFADTVQDLILRNRDFDDPLVPDLIDSALLVRPNLFRQRRADLRYRYNGSRVTAQLRPQYNEMRFLDDPTEDQDVRGVTAQVGYRMRRTLTLSLIATHREREYQNLVREDEDRRYALRGDYQMNRHWAWRAEVGRIDRDSTQPGASFDENTAQVALIWRR
jgi:hypothetical protein